jgi:putative peptidoglycan lipid II flippase
MTAAEVRTNSLEITAGASAAVSATRDSMAVSVWTLISRASGLVRVAVIGAVLGPTFFGNTFQVTNSLPNLVYYGFLAGSLFSSLLVPALVRHIDERDTSSSERVAGGFFGVSLVACLAIVPIAVAALPLILRFSAAGAGHPGIGAAQQRAAVWLVVMLIPQVFLYGVVGASTAVMNAHRRFALAAAAPAVENVGMIAVLLATGLLFGTEPRLGSVPPAQMLLLGIGSTCAVGLHAALQWWGARRVGVVLRPRAGWRDPEVRTIVRRALPSLAQAGLLALQVLAMLVVANRVAGGIVAFQMALNFYYLPVALVATPVALSLLPRLSRLHAEGDEQSFSDTLRRGYGLAMFLTIPAVAGFLILAAPLASVVAIGGMAAHGGAVLIATALATLAIGLVGQTTFMLASYAAYSRTDTRSPLTSVAIQSVICLGLLCCAVLVHGTAVLAVAGVSYSIANVVGGLHLARRVQRGLPRGGQAVVPSLLRTGFGTLCMAFPAAVASQELSTRIGGTTGTTLGLIAACVVGAGIFFTVQVLLRAPEVTWVLGGLRTPSAATGTVS